MGKVNIQIGRSTANRAALKVPSIALKNRIFEANPILNDGEAVSMFSRPRLKRWLAVGTGHIRKVFSSAGSFADDLFVVSGIRLYRVDQYTAAISDLGALGSDNISSVTFAVVQSIGDVPERMFIAEGGVLWVYTENGNAIGHLAASGTIANGDVVRIDGVYYQFTTGSVDAGTPLGTAANPWLVQRTGVTATDLDNLFDAIGDTGTAGTQYSTALTAHATVWATGATATDLYVTAQLYGSGGNSIVTTETGANIAWDNGTLTTGGAAQLRQIPLPDDFGAISIAHINSYIIVIPVQAEGIKGQFYWIEPGEVYIDPLNFATAERAPDGLNQVVVFSDMFWLLGQTTTEPWLTTGDVDAPMQRFKGVLFDRGSWEGTAVQVKDSLIVVDQDGAVFQISGGLKRISRPDIEERIRLSIQKQAFAGS